jgi:hypothetical protein
MSMPNSWSPLFYNIFKKMLIKKVFIDPNFSLLGIKPDCVLSNMVSKYPNPNDIEKSKKDIEIIFLNCKNNANPVSIPFDTNIPSSWTKELTKNLRDILPDTFDISNLDLDCLVTTFKNKYPDPNDFVSYVFQVQMDGGTSTSNPPVPSEIANLCNIKPTNEPTNEPTNKTNQTIEPRHYIKNRNNIRFIVGAVLVVLVGAIVYFMMRKTRMKKRK